MDCRCVVVLAVDVATMAGLSLIMVGVGGAVTGVVESLLAASSRAAARAAAAIDAAVTEREDPSSWPEAQASSLSTVGSVSVTTSSSSEVGGKCAIDL